MKVQKWNVTTMSITSPWFFSMPSSNGDTCRRAALKRTSILPNLVQIFIHTLNVSSTLTHVTSTSSVQKFTWRFDREKLIAVALTYCEWPLHCSTTWNGTCPAPRLLCESVYIRCSHLPVHWYYLTMLCNLPSPLLCPPVWTSHQISIHETEPLFHGWAQWSFPHWGTLQKYSHNSKSNGKFKNCLFSATTCWKEWECRWEWLVSHLHQHHKPQHPYGDYPER